MLLLKPWAMKTKMKGECQSPRVGFNSRASWSLLSISKTLFLTLRYTIYRRYNEFVCLAEMLTKLTRHAPSFLPPKTLTPHLTGAYLEGGPAQIQQVALIIYDPESTQHA